MPAPIVLVSDDEPMFGTALRRQLKPRGIEVLIDPSTDVVALAVALRPTVILLDLLQRRDGLVLLKELKAQPLTADIPVIVMSGVFPQGTTNEAACAGAMALGALAAVPKPLPDSFLELLVASLLSPGAANRFEALAPAGPSEAFEATDAETRATPAPGAPDVAGDETGDSGGDFEITEESVSPPAEELVAPDPHAWLCAPGEPPAHVPFDPEPWIAPFEVDAQRDPSATAHAWLHAPAAELGLDALPELAALPESHVVEDSDLLPEVELEFNLDDGLAHAPLRAA